MVRLKGGAPTVFGRGGEGPNTLRGRGLRDGAGGDERHRRAQGRRHPDDPPRASLQPDGRHRERGPDEAESAIDWDALADCVVGSGTLVVLMGVGRLAENARALCDRGVPETTPAAVVERATHEEEFTVTGTVATIAERGREVGVRERVVDCLDGATEARAGR